VARVSGSKFLSICLAIGFLLSGSVAPVSSAEALVLGDSIGEGLAKTVGLRHIAKRSFSLRRGDVGGQLAQLPSERVGLMSLGLNDAIDPVEHLSKSIEKVVQAATSVERKLVWIGPPCVLKKWDNRAAALDAHLKQRLAATPIQYVSLRDEKICAPGIRTRDGEHFTLEGYRYVWEKIRRDSPFAASVVLDPCETARAEAMYRGRKPPHCGEQQAKKN
jgi:hypothetical protein